MSANISVNRRLYLPEELEKAWTPNTELNVDDLREAFGYAIFTSCTYHYTSRYRIEGKVVNVKIN